MSKGCSGMSNLFHLRILAYAPAGGYHEKKLIAADSRTI